MEMHGQVAVVFIVVKEVSQVQGRNIGIDREMRTCPVTVVELC